MRLLYFGWLGLLAFPFSFSILPTYTVYFNFQASDKSDRPVWNDVKHKSGEFKSLWRHWERLSMVEGVLIRLFEAANGKKHGHKL